jgi:DNA-binding CsgD family transcriptional regulator
MTGDHLTTREQEILQLTESGLTNQAIAKELGISKNAVRFHLKELHSKLATGGEREALRRWRPNWRVAALPFGFASLTSGIATGAIVAAIALGGFAAYRLYLGDGVETPAAILVDGRYQNGCPAEFNAGTMTLADFASGSHATLDELHRLNPGLGDGQLAPDTIVHVPYDPDTQCVQAIATPPGAQTAALGTPQSGRP